MKATKKTRINGQIAAKEIRLIDANHNQVGIVDIKEALAQAEEAELDLVEIVPNSSPPVCRIMDYGKYVFTQNKKRSAQKKKQKQIQVKIIKLRPNTDIGDYQVKLRKMAQFLGQGHKVKLVVRFRGREMLHQELGREILQRIENDTKNVAIVEQVAKLEGRQLVMLLGPVSKDARSGHNESKQ